ncbi:MAG: PadR family transcriptional regulator [Methanobrevibacter sp.]|nr:PadR family transcriptional regulator [Methanobrevibacter sp.]
MNKFGKDKMDCENDCDQNPEFSRFDKHILKNHTYKDIFHKKMLRIMVLWIISKERTYGYAVLKKLNEGWDKSIEDEDIDFNNSKRKQPFGSNRIYPLLKALELGGFIKGSEEMDGKRKIKYYEITKKGTLFLEKIKTLIAIKTPPIFKEFFKENFFDNDD